ncbi:MAG: hypothetical protein OQL28_11365 [Sedimenticola sp.]|nr:hypothetical protein [Sedimenticola sp.]
MSLRVPDPERRLYPAPPLWRRLPTRSGSGSNLNDFMLLIPGFREWPDARRERVCAVLRELLDAHGERVVFADLNVKLNLLWISHQQGKGVALGLFESIRERVPEAVLVASQAEVLHGMQRRSRTGGVLRRLLPWQR